jgi:hypothetical protein
MSIWCKCLRHKPKRNQKQEKPALAPRPKTVLRRKQAGALPNMEASSIRISNLTDARCRRLTRRGRLRRIGHISSRCGRRCQTVLPQHTRSVLQPTAWRSSVAMLDRAPGGQCACLALELEPCPRGCAHQSSDRSLSGVPPVHAPRGVRPTVPGLPRARAHALSKIGPTNSNLQN